MRVILCDRCSAVINPASSGTSIQYEPGNSSINCFEYVLCVSCAYKLKKWLDMEDAE
jgi:hypothetical protein